MRSSSFEVGRAACWRSRLSVPGAGSQPHRVDRRPGPAAGDGDQSPDHPLSSPHLQLPDRRKLRESGRCGGGGLAPLCAAPPARCVNEFARPTWPNKSEEALRIARRRKAKSAGALAPPLVTGISSAQGSLSWRLAAFFLRFRGDEPRDGFQQRKLSAAARRDFELGLYALVVRAPGLIEPVLPEIVVENL